MTLFDTAWALVKEEGQRRTVKPHALEELGNRTNISFGEGIDDATAFMNLPLKTVVNFKGDAKQRIGPNPPKPNDETGWHQVAHLPFIDGSEAEEYGAYESESNALKDLMNAAAPIPFAQDGFYHPYLHALDYDTNEWVTHLGEDAPPTGDYERVFRAKVIQDGGPFSVHNPVYPDWVWTKIEREQDEDGKHHLTLYTAKYPYSLDELYENLQENPEPYFESGAIQVDDNIQTGEPMSIAWDLVKAILPNLPVDAELNRFGGRGIYEKDAITYELGIDPEDARRILDDNYGFFMRDIDALKYPTQIDAWRRELDDNPALFQFPNHIMSRLSGRHSNEQAMGIEDFRNLALHRDYNTKNNMMTRYVDEMERRGSPVIVGNAQISPAKQELHTITVNPGFEGRGFGRHLLGAMLQETGGVHDNVFSREGYNLVRNLGNLLTQGGEQSIVPFLQRGGDISDFNRQFYGNKGLIDSVLGDVRFTQPYGQDLFDGGEGYWSLYEDEGLTYSPPNFYPIEFSMPVAGVSTGVNPDVIGRKPFGITYTGDDPAFITNLGVE